MTVGFFAELYSHLTFDWKTLKQVQKDILASRGATHIETARASQGFLGHCSTRYHMGLAGNSRLVFMVQLYRVNPYIEVRDVYFEREAIDELIENGYTRSEAIIHCSVEDTGPSQKISAIKELELRKYRPAKPKKIVFGRFDQWLQLQPFYAH